MKHKKTIYWILGFFILAVFANTKKAEDDKEQEESENLAYAQVLEKEKLELVRQDSLVYFNHISDSLVKRKQLKKAIQFLDTAILYANYTAKDSLVDKKADHFIARRKYGEAIESLTVLASNNYELGETYFKRAKCYQKKRLKQEAVDDLRQAINYGNSDAEKLYEKINPERKRVSYYVTRCCDGSTSYAKGRGACSHHGGVCNWNEPVYETYRKY